MERLDPNKFYFIYCQNGNESKVAKIEENNSEKNIKEIKTEKKDNYIYTIYCITLPNNFKGNELAITLIDKSAKLYYKTIFIREKEKFKFGMLFESYHNKEIDPLNQKKLSYKEQFIIFQDNIKKENYLNDLNDLFLNSINEISQFKSKEINYEFLLFLFTKIFNYIQRDEFFKKTIKKYFEDLNFKILENEIDAMKELENETKSCLDIEPEDLKVLLDKDPYKIRNQLISITGNDEEINKKIDIFLCFYYIFYKPSLFVSFVDTKKDKFEEIKSHIISHKNLFNDFNSNVLNFQVMDETQNLEQIQGLLSNFVPNMVELLKILSNYLFYCKLICLTQIEQKMIPILSLCKPKKTDDMDELMEFYDKIIELFLSERNLPIYFGKEFYIEYCKTFLNEDFDKIEKVRSMLKNYNIHVSDKFKIKIEKEIDQYYHDTGIFLINKKKLINNEVIEFIKNDPYFKEKENIIPYDLLAEGIVFEEKYNKFTNEFLNNQFDDFDLKEFFGDSYYDFMKAIFNKFKRPKDFLSIKNWKMTSDIDIDIEILENFMYAIKRVWLGDPQNHMWGLEKLIAQTFGKASFKMNNYLTIIKDLEKKIPNYLILPIYTEILYRDYPLKDTFKDHIISFIRYNSEKNVISIWYLLNTYEDDEDQKREYLENNLIEEYAVKAENFIDYPIITDERISLFTNLYNGNYFNKFENLINMPYYTESINSKDNIYNLKYLETMKMYKNITQFQNLFLFFIRGPYREENAFIIDSLLIDFSDKCDEAKKYYDSLNIIYNHWNKFYKNEKRNEQNDLKELISQYENTSLKECKNLKINNKFYLNYLPEAKEGEKLMESIFFMSIYESNKDEFKSRDRDRYEATLKTFNELKKLGIDSDINKLDSKLKDILIDSLFKNQDKLKDELNFIKSYFGFVGKNNLKITKISKNLFKLVEEYKKENKFKNIEIKFNDIAEDIEKKEQNKKEENDIKIIEDNKNSIIDIQGHIKTGKDNLIKEIKKLEDNFLLEEKKNKNIEFDIINKENNPQNFIFNSFYKKIFETNFGYAKLDDKEFYDEIIYKAKKLYVHGIRLGLMNKMDNNNEFLLLITEFYNIIEAYELSNQNNKYNECKKFFFPLLHLIYEYYNNKDEKKLCIILMR